ncbi:uncharacterized protein RCC_10808 [Ramularia collo-cygni]|uniref:Uncharacterized protein n=1 Tax=Ramularia collo-cygni TaxID=112498 RepID=A0A2D3VRN9_9PEZI|nr:uncharacterized protein RCC_10808 [Ramularia collo-cygni]CZT25078.1 uncharacterized protein RCC_10808 [Ramularia collo-cygni]
MMMQHVPEGTHAQQTCSSTSEQQLNNQRYAAAAASAKNLTPPPSHAGTPRSSTGMSLPASLAYDDSRRRYVAPALNRAFSSEDEDELDDRLEDDDSTTSSLFPSSMYRIRAVSKRNPARTRSESSSSLSQPAGSVSRMPDSSASRPDSGKESRSMTPDMMTASAPMSAAFARLNHKDAPERMQRGRSLPLSQNLGAKMFEGAA